MVLKFEKRSIVWLQLFIAFTLTIQPKLFTQYKATVIIYALGNLAIFVYYFLKVCRNGIISKYLVAWSGLRLYFLLVMLFNGQIQDIDQWGYLTLMVCNYILIFDWCSRNGWIKEMLIALASVCLIFLLINAISLITFPEGIIPSQAMYDNGDGDYYFLGIKTAYTSYIFIALAVSGICSIKYKMNKLCILTVGLSIFNIFYANISTGIVCVFSLLLLIVIKKVFKVQVTLNFAIVAAMVLNIAIVLFDAQYIFSGLIENILHKNVTLTGRTDIWRNALLQLKGQNVIKLLLGNGIVNGGSFVYFGAGRWPAHNQWLQNIFEYGLAGTAGLIWFMYESMKKSVVYSKIQNYLLDIIFVMLIGTITMQYLGYSHVYLLFILLKYSAIIEEVDLKYDAT